MKELRVKSSINVGDTVLVFDPMSKIVQNGIVKQLNINIIEDDIQVAFVIIIDAPQPYAITMNDSFVWKDKEELLDFATNLIKDL